MWEYTDTVRDHFLNPRNSGVLEDANVIGEAGSLACGDALKLMLKVNKEGIIEDAKFLTFGCASAIASSSALTLLIIGKHMDEAAKLTNKDIAEFLGGLPKEKMHCSVMGEEALEDAIRHWKGLPSKKHEEGRLVCKCFAVTDQQIIKVVKENGLKTVEDVTNFIKAGGACGDCSAEIQSILDSLHAIEKPLVEIRPAGAAMTNVQRMQKVMQVIASDIAPKLALDGGSIELVDISGPNVFVQLQGACSGCGAARLTLKNLVETTLREKVDPAINVMEA